MSERTRRVPILCGLAGGALVLGACAGGRDGRRLTEADFVGEAPIAADSADAPEAAGPPVPVVQLDEMVRLADAEAIAGPPVIDPDSPPARDASPVLIDELVGEINGRPIFATEFLDSLAGRLRQLPVDIEEKTGQRPTPALWRQEAMKIIGARLNEIIENELVIAEGYGALPVQQAGIRRFVEALRANQISLLGGSKAAADRTIQQEEGISTDELLQNKTDEAVLQNYFQQMAAGLSVSQRDLKREYERREAEFNPPPTAVFRWIRIPDTDEAAYERISEGIASGVSFETLSHDEASMFKDTGGLQRREFEGAFAEITIFRGPSEPLNGVLASLEPGEIAGPIHLDGWYHWLELEEIIVVSQSFYDAQVQLEREFREREFFERYESRLRRLRERAGITDQQIQRLADRLLVIAEERFYEGG